MVNARSPEVIPPEKARTVAFPEVLPGLRRTVQVPSCVRASLGSIVPIVVVKSTTVPLCTGMPPARS